MNYLDVTLMVQLEFTWSRNNKTKIIFSIFKRYQRLVEKLDTSAICAGHLASYLNTIVLKEATTFAERI